MTQAFNLSQLANKVNTSGQLDASTGLYNQTSVANGGTGKSSVTSGSLLVGAGTSAMTELAGSAVDDVVKWSGTAWISGVGGGSAAPTATVYIAPGTWTKPATVKGIKVTVVGAGGNGGNAAGSPSPQTFSAGGGGGAGGAAIRWLDAPNIPGPIAVTAGAGTNSFGTLASATAGSAGGGTNNTSNVGGTGGVGSSGTINLTGNAGGGGVRESTGGMGGTGGGSILGGGGRGSSNANGNAGKLYGGGGGGAAKNSTNGTTTGGAGANGIVIVEEFY